MKKLIPAVWLIGLFLPVAAAAQSAWDGTWKIDIKSAKYSAKPDTVLLKDGVYECSTCTPPVKVKADGTDQKVSGSQYYDTAAIKIVNDRTVQEIDKKNGKVVATSTTVVSPDGKTATIESVDSSNTNSAPVTGKGTTTRVAAGPAGSHAISGQWKIDRADAISDNALTFTMKMEGNTVHVTSPTGQSYVAKLDGPDAPYKGDPGLTTVSLKRIDKNTFEETDKFEGKALYVGRITLSADGKSLDMKNHDLRRDDTSEFTAHKQ
jgi:hypothetical protein